MQRWWASWWTGNYADEGCTRPPFQFWCSGHRMRFKSGGHHMDSERDEQSLCAVLDAESEQEIWDVVCRHFPDFTPRFCIAQPSDFVPSDRFPGFENRTSLAVAV